MLGVCGLGGVVEVLPFKSSFTLACTAEALCPASVNRLVRSVPLPQRPAITCHASSSTPIAGAGGGVLGVVVVPVASLRFTSLHN